jgi:hypothetical protein
LLFGLLVSSRLGFGRCLSSSGNGVTGVTGGLFSGGKLVADGLFSCRLVGCRFIRRRLVRCCFI